MNRPTSRRAVLAAALAAAAGAGAAPAARATDLPSARIPVQPLVDHAFWTSYADWSAGVTDGTLAVSDARPSLVIAAPAGRTGYTDPHTGTSADWEYATWTSPVHRPQVPATELIPSWNALTPAGSWLRIEVRGSYSDGTDTPWYMMGNWASGDGADDIRRTSVDGQGDGRSSVLTDTLAIDDPASGLRLVSYQVRLTLHRKPGTTLTPTVHRVGAITSDVPDRFTVPASAPGLVRELSVPRYSQNTHLGQYPEYDNGGEAWCSPTSSQMIIEYWGRRPSARELAWVNPDFADPQVCHAARFSYDHQYQGCGNWPFSAAYAATYQDMSSAVTRLGSLSDVETLVSAGIPVITSQSFLADELPGAGYGTPGHLMTVIGFTGTGDVIANDPASPSNTAVRRVYPRAAWETVWLRTKRYNASGAVASGSGGVAYVFWPAKPTAGQQRALASLGLL